MKYHVVYDGNCNLCVTFTQLLASFDQGKQFDYIPMQDTETLEGFGISPKDCEMGMILIEAQNPHHQWQGSNAVEEITHLLPLGNVFIATYRALPGIKWLGDRTYEQVRDNRYNWFGRRERTYPSPYPVGCEGDNGCDSMHN